MFVGLIVGVAAGVAGVVAFAVVSDQDIRDVVRKAQKQVESIDFEAVEAQIQEGMAEVGARIDETVTKAKAIADKATGNGANVAEEAADAIAETEPVASA
jgi:hypothetical protein